MNLFHIHRWIELCDIVVTDTVQGGRYCRARYRHCERCGKWQKYGGNYADTWWDDCDRPKNASELRSWN
jgi:hypothetical protein